MSTKLSIRGIHRDLGYFYLGLIIAFSFSGIFLNHRTSWYPSNYVYSTEEINVPLPKEQDAINEGFIAQLSKEWKLEDQFKGFRVRGNTLRITYADYMFEIDIPTGKGTKEGYVKVPLLAQFTELHVTTNGGWVWYSDIFGTAMLTIAITGMFIQKGKTSFKQRGWKFALVGIIFPLIFLFVLA